MLAEALKSILAQRSADVEIVISDNASTDNTAAMVAKLQKQYPEISYHRSAQNQGFDLNVLRVVELAKGKYCWFLGDDDRIEPNGVAEVLAALAAYPDLGGICLGVKAYDKDMQKETLSWNPTLGKYHNTTLFQNADQCFSVLGHYLSFFSAQVINRAAWMEIFQTGSWREFCEGFVHFYMIASVLKNQPCWLYLAPQCVGWRSGNDPLLAAVGFYERLRFDIEGGEKVICAVLGKRSPAYHAIMRTGAAVHSSSIVLNARLNNIDVRTRIQIAKLCFRYYGRYLPFWTNLIPILIMPTVGLRFVRYLARMYKKVFWPTG